MNCRPVKSNPRRQHLKETGIPGCGIICVQTGKPSVFEPLIRGESFNFQLSIGLGHPGLLFFSCTRTGNWHTFDIIDNKGNSFQTIKTSDILKHQPTVWPVPYACAHPYHQGAHSRSSCLLSRDWRRQELFSPSVMRKREELWGRECKGLSGNHGQLDPCSLKCSLPFTAQAGTKQSFIKAPAPHNTCGSYWLFVRYCVDRGLVFQCVTCFYRLFTPFSSKGQPIVES